MLNDISPPDVVSFEEGYVYMWHTPFSRLQFANTKGYGGLLHCFTPTTPSQGLIALSTKTVLCLKSGRHFLGICLALLMVSLTFN